MGPEHESRRATATVRPGWLFPVEIGWYLVIVVVIVTGGAPPVPASVGYGVWSIMLALGLLAAVTTLVRWWRPGWSWALGLGVIGVGSLVIGVLSLGSLGPLRLMLSCAVVPVLLVATMRRAAPLPALLVVVLAAVGAGVDVGRRGNTLSADIARAVHGPSPSSPFVLTTAALLVLVPVAFGILLRSTDAAQRAEHYARVRAEERLQVARELHDMVANHVTGIVVLAQAAGLDPAVPTATGRALTSIEAAGDAALAAMHRMVGALRSRPTSGGTASNDSPVDGLNPSGTDELPTTATTPLAAVRAAIGEDDGVRLTIGDGLGDGSTVVTADVATTVHRIVVESLTNARRHRPTGSGVEVSLSSPRPSLLVLDIVNDRGRGPSRTRGGGFGLVGLTERAAAVGGRLEAGPVDDGRWRVHAELPV